MAPLRMRCRFCRVAIYGDHTGKLQVCRVAIHGDLVKDEAYRFS